MTSELDWRILMQWRGVLESISLWHSLCFRKIFQRLQPSVLPSGLSPPDREGTQAEVTREEDLQHAI